MKTALILVDVQNDFLPGGALAVPDGDAILPTVNALQKCFDLVIATQDFHPEGHGSFADSHEGKEVYDKIDLNGLEQVLWPVHCVAGTAGAEFSQELLTHRLSNVFPKGQDMGIDSYSGFFDNGRRQSTGMGEYLKAEGVDAVFVVGLAADFCVKFTALDAVSLGFQTYLVEDATRGVNITPGDVDRAIEEMREAGVIVVNSAMLLSDN
ncbi:UNVERIFIED_CONTAM: hypothetical protein GTU68_029166 [Idotea baltica]|nr:hypothetical protein [Idotea baltica]